MSTSSSSRRYLISCGTSRIGLEVARNLGKYSKKANVESIVLGTRNLSNGFKWAMALQEEYSSVLFGTACLDLKCPKSCQRAFSGVTDLVLLAPPCVKDVYKYCQIMAEFGHLNGVERVNLVAPTLSDNSEYEKQITEVCSFIQALRFPYNVIRFHPILLDNIQYQMGAFLEGRFKSALKPDVKFSYTTCSDVGMAVAYATALKDYRGKDAFYITGPDTINLNEFVGHLSKILPLQVENITFEMERELMLEKGTLYGEHDFIEALIEVHRNINAGNPVFVRVTDDFKILVGKKPMSSTDYLTKVKPILTLMGKQAAKTPQTRAATGPSTSIGQSISDTLSSARKSLEVS